MPSRPLLSPRLSVEFLGSGTSTGVPMIGCECAVCQSPHPRNKRMRPSIVVTVHAANEEKSASLLVDTTPDMRSQMLRAGINQIDATLITHIHADHLFGMDDIRQFNFRQKVAMPIYATSDTQEHIRTVFSYCFRETQKGGGKPQLLLHDLAPGEAVDICGVGVLPLTVLHGEMPVLAFKFGERFAYVTDVSSIPPDTQPFLRGLDTLILGTVRHEPHPTHFGLQQALDEVAELAPRQVYFTHLSHHFDHDTVNATLPPNVRLGYDGLRFEVPAA